MPKADGFTKTRCAEAALGFFMVFARV